jgi:hypothetical protein
LKFETIINKIKYPPRIIQRAAVCFFSCDFKIKLGMILAYVRFFHRALGVYILLSRSMAVK